MFHLSVTAHHQKKLIEEAKKLPHVKVTEEADGSYRASLDVEGAHLVFEPSGADTIAVHVADNPKNVHESEIRSRLESDIKSLIGEA